MSYYTYYNLRVKGIHSETEYKKVADKLRELDVLNYALVEDTYIPGSNIQHFSSYEDVNWFSSSVDMREVSKAFPKMVFELTGEGEDPSDLWKTYYQNGKAEFCQAEVHYPSPVTIKWE